jgi:hypothetical protein
LLPLQEPQWIEIGHAVNPVLCDLQREH